LRRESKQITKLELMTVMRSLKKLHERGMPDAALEVINEIIAEAETSTIYRNVMSWLETEYLVPAVDIAKKAVTTTDDEAEKMTELKELEKLLEEALHYVRRHQK